jgi:NADP-dependent 3-hydroxy acid dehydrogenase YdfG
MSLSNLNASALFNVKDKIVLVTGGSSGIGKMMANGFCQNGAKVYIASRKEKQLKEAVAELNQKAKVPVQYIIANVGVSLASVVNFDAGCFVNRVVESRV